MKLSYSHCVKYTHGQLDLEPWSKYETRTVDFTIKRWPCDEYNDKEEFQILVLGKPVSGCHVDLQEAIDEAKYMLMSGSRDIAENESRLSGRFHTKPESEGVYDSILCPRCGKRPDPLWEIMDSGIQCKRCQYFIPSVVLELRLPGNPRTQQQESTNEPTTH